MRTPFLPVPPVLSLLAVVALAACASNPAGTPTTWDPMPLGETAPLHMPRPLELTLEHEFVHAWTDARGRCWNIAFRCKYTTDDAHELLAAACVTTNLVTAHEATLAICKSADLDTIDGIVACEESLQQQLTDVLFPCSAATEVASVSGIEWTLWVVR